jgi:hypothetical protein
VRRLGGEPERREEPPHGVGLGHRAQDPPPALAAVTHQHLKPEHPLEQPRPGPEVDDPTYARFESVGTARASGAADERTASHHLRSSSRFPLDSARVTGM